MHLTKNWEDKDLSLLQGIKSSTSSTARMSALKHLFTPIYRKVNHGSDS